MVRMLPNHVDVMVIGGGAAGLYAALWLPSHLQVGLFTKDSLSLSASGWAQGGMAAAIAPDDSVFLHLEDTLQAGAGLCEPDAVKLLVENASECVQSLLEMGVAFDRSGNALALTLEAAHSRRRVLHAADTTGRAVITTLAAQVLNRSNIQVWSQTIVLDLWMEGNQCIGACLLQHGQISCVRATVVVLATGGGGQVFAQTTNPESSTGDGVAMAWRAGAELRDLEFIQFHPTALTQVGAPRFLISEAVRGEGAHLIDEEGNRFAFDYHPQGEIAPRDVVSRAIFTHLQTHLPKSIADPADGHVWLDLRSIDPERVQYRFPNIIQVCQQWGINVFEEPIPVAPAAHYWMGGITVDLFSQTTVAGLYAVGETASTGVHGANRLASNSLLECLVFGAQLKLLKIDALERHERLYTSSEAIPSSLEFHQLEQKTIAQLRQELPRLMWKGAGICREQSLLNDVLKDVEEGRKVFSQLPVSQFLTSLQPGQLVQCSTEDSGMQLRQWIEIRNLLDIAYLILKSAIFRTESRGGHYRSDYPHVYADWQVHTLVRQHQWLKSMPSQPQLS